MVRTRLLPGLPGVWPSGAARLLVEVGDIVEFPIAGAPRDP